ncbi:hypothetical protein ACVIGA_002168 [Bradyrhizobium sp. USDA 3240]
MDLQLPEQTNALDRYLRFGPTDLRGNLSIAPPEGHAPQELLFTRAQEQHRTPSRHEHRNADNDERA